MNIYKEILSVLNSPSCFTKFYHAVDKDGNEVDSLSPKACAWCIEGAFMKVQNNRECISCLNQEWDKFSKSIYKKTNKVPFRFNDLASYEVVVSILEELAEENNVNA